MARKGSEFVTMYLTADIKAEWEKELAKPENAGLSMSEILKQLILKDTNPATLFIEIDDITRQRIDELRRYYGKREGNALVSDTTVIRNAVEEKAREVASDETNVVRLTKLYAIVLDQNRSFQELRQSILEWIDSQRGNQL